MFAPQIAIAVLDQNDNGPEWDEVPSDLNNLNVSENERSALVYTLSASDSDQQGQYLYQAGVRPLHQN